MRAVLVICVACLVIGSQPVMPETRLPEGGVGIAASHPGDVGIDEHASVVFVEDFAVEAVGELEQRWDSVGGPDIMSLSDDTPTGEGQSLLVTHVGGQGTGGQLYRRLLPGHDRVFARTYVKFDPDCAKIHHFGTHLGGFDPPTPWPQGGAGTRPDGAKRFTTGVEPYGDEWAWDFYTYWQGMHVHGDGNYWGTPFLTDVERPKVDRGRWICVEMMVTTNDVGASDGEQAFWIDGELVRSGGEVVSHAGPGFPNGEWTGGWWRPDATAETAFEGFNWRSVEQLAVNYLWTYVYITKAAEGHVSKVWFDNIVVATEYIGPITPRD
jgi:hypothetical protein